MSRGREEIGGATVATAFKRPGDDRACSARGWTTGSGEGRSGRKGGPTRDEDGVEYGGLGVSSAWELPCGTLTLAAAARIDGAGDQLGWQDRVSLFPSCKAEGW
jgi:hypothetical protein